MCRIVFCFFSHFCAISMGYLKWNKKVATDLTINKKALRFLSCAAYNVPYYYDTLHLYARCKLRKTFKTHSIHLNSCWEHQKTIFFFSRSNHIKGIKETHNPFALHLSRTEFCFHFAPLFCAMCTNFISINVFFLFAVFSICVLYFVLLVVRTIVQLNINVYTVCTTARYRL